MTTKTKAAEYPRTMDPRTIMFNEENPRSEIGDLSDILPSIKDRLARGLPPLIQDITIRPFGIGFKVAAGSRRLAACLEAGATEIGVRVEEMSDEYAHELALAENIIRKEMTVLDEIRAVGKLAATGENHAEIAARFGRSPRWVSTRAKIAQMPERVLELIGAGDLSISVAEELCRLGNAETVVEMAENAANLGYGIPQMRSQIDSKLRGLADAPWVTGRSECARCIQRSDKQVSLFEDGGPARCMDSLCWEAKKTAWLKAKEDELRKQGYLPKQEHINKWQFLRCSGEILDPEIEQAEIAEMEAAGIKPRFVIDEEAPYEVHFRYDHSDMPEKTEKTSSSDDVPEAEDLHEDEGEDVQELRKELEECVEEEGEEEDEDVFEPSVYEQARAERIFRKVIVDQAQARLVNVKSITDWAPIIPFIAEVLRVNISSMLDDVCDSVNDNRRQAGESEVGLTGVQTSELEYALLQALLDNLDAKDEAPALIRAIGMDYEAIEKEVRKLSAEVAE